MLITYLIFTVLTVVAYRLYYEITIDEPLRYREDARILLWIAAVSVGDVKLLTFTVLLHFICYLYEVRRFPVKLTHKITNLFLNLLQAAALYLVFHLFKLWFPMTQPLLIMATMFGTVVITQGISVILTASLFAISLRSGGWKRQLLKYNLMDSTYVSLYFITTMHLHDWVPQAVWYDLTLTALVSITIGLYYWRTVGIRQTQRVNSQVLELTKLNTQLTEANQQVLLAFASSLEKRDPYTAGHSERVAFYAVEIARELGHSEQELELIHLGGLLHDIGKIGIPDYVLNKPDRLTDEEYTIMKQHPVLGEELLRRVYTASNILPEEDRERMLEIVLYHHERPDGRGYPRGLTEEEIPHYARLTAVADAFDAMTSNRAYRKAMPVERAINIIREGRGQQFYGPAVDAFFQALERIQNDNSYAEIAATIGLPTHEQDEPPTP